MPQPLAKGARSNLACITRAPLLSILSLVSYKLLYTSYHTASSCGARLQRPVYDQDSVIGSLGVVGGFHDTVLAYTGPLPVNGNAKTSQEWH
jgi:hypothetical protein